VCFASLSIRYLPLLVKLFLRLLFGSFSSGAARILPAAVLFVYGGPGAFLGLFGGDALLLIAFLDMIGFSLLLGCVFASTVFSFRHTLSPFSLKDTRRPYWPVAAGPKVYLPCTHVDIGVLLPSRVASIISDRYRILRLRRRFSDRYNDRTILLCEISHVLRKHLVIHSPVMNSLLVTFSNCPESLSNHHASILTVSFAHFCTIEYRID